MILMSCLLEGVDIEVISGFGDDFGGYIGVIM